MNKLQRYKTATVKGMKQFSEWSTGYDVSALEAENERLLEERQRLVEILKTSDCPTCQNQGWYMKQGADEEVYEEQCQWCAERDAILNREQEEQP